MPDVVKARQLGQDRQNINMGTNIDASPCAHIKHRL